jgi:hypothetical protein
MIIYIRMEEFVGRATVPGRDARAVLAPRPRRACKARAARAVAEPPAGGLRWVWVERGQRAFQGRPWAASANSKASPPPGGGRLQGQTRLYRRREGRQARGRGTGSVRHREPAQDRPGVRLSSPQGQRLYRVSTSRVSLADRGFTHRQIRVFPASLTEPDTAKCLDERLNLYANAAGAISSRTRPQAPKGGTRVKYMIEYTIRATGLKGPQRGHEAPSVSA